MKQISKKNKENKEILGSSTCFLSISINLSLPFY